MKSSKVKHKESHTAPTKLASGDFYGQGMKNKVGKSIEGMGFKTISKSKMGKPPKSLA